MKILILSTSHPFKTAGIIVKDLNFELNRRGHNSVLMVKTFDNYSDKSIINYHTKFGFYFYDYLRRIVNKITKQIPENWIRNKVSTGFSVQTYNQIKSLSNVDRILRLTPFNPDLIFVFFTQKFISFKDLYSLQKKTGSPILYNIPDMSAFTGLCHYSWGCENYLNICGNCKAIKSSKLNDRSYLNLKSKLFYSEKLNISGLGVSYWIIERAQKSSVFKRHDIYKIPSLTTRSDYHSISNHERSNLRSKHQIDEDAIVISFGAVGLSDTRKGIRFIIEALNGLEQHRLFNRKVHIIYSGNGSLPISINKYDSYYMGMLDFQRLKELYQMSDLYISASIEDVGPGTIMEAITCGIPVVSFDVGIAQEWVIPHKTGYLTKDNTSQEIINGVWEIITVIDENPIFFNESCSTFSKKKNDYSKYYDTIENIMRTKLNK